MCTMYSRSCAKWIRQNATLQHSPLLHFTNTQHHNGWYTVFSPRCSLHYAASHMRGSYNRMNLTPWSRFLPEKLIISSARQEINHITWNPKVNYRIHKNPLPVPVLSQADLVQASYPLSSRSILILFSQLRLVLSTGLFLSAFPTKIF